MSRPLLPFVLGVALLLGGSQVQAKVIVWTLENVTFSDGATASGTFTLDESFPGLLSAVDIHTTESASIPAHHYVTSSADIRSSQMFINDGARLLAMTFQFPIASSSGTEIVGGGTNPIDLANPQNYEYLYSSTLALRTITGGQITAVPEPATVLLLIGGLGVLGFVYRTKRQDSR
jgi:hypothetical protein